MLLGRGASESCLFLWSLGNSRLFEDALLNELFSKALLVNPQPPLGVPLWIYYDLLIVRA
jgi:hypothetical protein